MRGAWWLVATLPLLWGFAQERRTANDGLLAPRGSLTHDYEGVELPEYYTSGPVALADNTPSDNPITNGGANLGRVLFFDRRLSVNDAVACASCHQQVNGFADPRPRSAGFRGGRTSRHSMGLINVRYFFGGRMFWDERAFSLEDQATRPLADQIEMGWLDMRELTTKLEKVDFYPPLFRAAFGDDEITMDRIALALAQFQRTLVSYRSRYDQALKNPDHLDKVLTADELRGMALFGALKPSEMEVYDLHGARSLGCANCHQTEAMISGMRPADPGTAVEDRGYSRALRQGIDNGLPGNPVQFKAPSLRNIELTAPYMHDARFSTLDQVLNHYSEQVVTRRTLDPRLRENEGTNDPARKLNLTQEEKEALIAFLKTLTDRAMMEDPMFSDPFGWPPE
ncbi:MAG: c-type cytochrome [Fimbriimonadaceae bacterium]|nr:c-type cytochrome [Fimbriimonadaceae bacterium]